MRELKEGDVISVPCEVAPGPFPNERLITIETDSGELTGFILEQFLSSTTNEKSFIRGTVLEIQPDTVTVQLPGSFFTSGARRTSVNSNWVKSNWPLAATAG